MDGEFTASALTPAGRQTGETVGRQGSSLPVPLHAALHFGGGACGLGLVLAVGMAP
ncbi:hypothetical protein AB0I66_35340 [Streptomyces sp. NPDC050439]|uniref:hypothetical protein n=1 Tax=unclassified Streptomyces TaxID=2593676 RepID=UPI003426D497